MQVETHIKDHLLPQLLHLLIIIKYFLRGHRNLYLTSGPLI